VNSPTAQTTEVDQPNRRAFLDQTYGERVKGFWWSIVRFTLFRWSPATLNAWRRSLLRLFGATIHRTARIAPSVRIDFPWNLQIAPDVVISHRAIINCMGKVVIGRGAHLSQYAHLCAGTHDYTRRDMKIVRCPIDIGCDVWIAADAFVGPGVTIGDGALLAARSSAFRDMPPGQVCIGEPAHPRRPWTDSPVSGA